MDWTFWLEWVIKGFVLCLVLLTGFAYLTYYERRALARMQNRIGPNRAGPQGLLQPIADAVKLIFKEELTPAKTFKVVFFLAPIFDSGAFADYRGGDSVGYIVPVVWPHDHFICGGHQRGCVVFDVHRFDCGIWHCAGGLVVE